MSTSVTFNGTSYTVPAIGDASWGTNVSNYIIAIASGCLQKTGGAFTLSQADIDFGATYGLKAVYFKSETANIASAGVVQLARTDVISWRNQANGADLSLSVDSSNNLSFNGALLVNLALGGAYAVLQMNAGATAYSWATPTGTGAPALQTSPSFTTPTLGVATATSINKMAITAPATSSTLAVADGKTLTASNTLTFAGTDGNTMTFPSGSSTVMTLASVDSISGAKTFASTKLIATNVVVSGNTLTFPAAADTLMGKATTDTMTNKTATLFTISSGSYIDMLVQAAVRFNDDSGGDYIAVKAPTGVTTHTLLLPATQGAASSVLTNDGSGNLSWGSALTTTLSQFNTFIGNASNVATAVNTNLLGDISGTAVSQSYTVTSAAPGVFTVGTAPNTGDKCYVTVTQNGFTANTTYYATNVSGTTFKLATTLANAVAGTNITSSGTTAGTIVSGGFVLTSGTKATQTNDSAVAGYVGEYQIQSRLKSAAVSTGTTNTPLNVTTSPLALTPGDWDISATFSVKTNASGTNISEIQGAISKTSATIPGSDTENVPTSGEIYVEEEGVTNIVTGNGNFTNIIVPLVRASISTATSFYLVANVIWTGSQPTVFGSIYARRIR